MKFKTLHYSGLLIGGLVLATSCIDDKYDLSDIDTTTAIKLDNLVVPVNLNEITLDQVLDIDENDPDATITIVDGYYAIKKEGNINETTIELGTIEATAATVPELLVPDIAVPTSLTVSIPETYTDYSYLVKDVDESIQSVKHLYLKEGEYLPIEISVGLYGAGDNSIVENLVIAIPEEFEAIYKGQQVENGILNLGNLSQTGSEPIWVKGINFITDEHPNGIEAYETENGWTLSFEGKIGIKSADIKVEKQSEKVTFYAHFSLGGFVVERIVGDIEYQVTPPVINAVSLSDLPDFLSQDDTMLELVNPQIYVSLNNMVGAPCYTGLSLTPVRDNQTNPNYTVDITVGSNPSEDEYFNLLIAPDPKKGAFLNTEKWKNSTPVEFTDLKYIIGSKDYTGIPKEIEISLVDPIIRGEVDINLNNPIEFSGDYMFFTPLSLAEGSTIVYSKEERDFFGDDMEDVRVDVLSLTANVTTNLPFAVTLTAKPLDKNGNPIKNIVAKAVIPANASNSPINLEFNESFTGLDGVYYEAVVVVGEDESLAPSQHIKLDNIRAKVSGEYVTKL